MLHNFHWKPIAEVATVGFGVEQSSLLVADDLPISGELRQEPFIVGLGRCSGNGHQGGSGKCRSGDESNIHVRPPTSSNELYRAVHFGGVEVGHADTFAESPQTASSCR